MFNIIGNPGNHTHASVMHKLIKQFVPYSQGKLGWDQPVTINLLSDPDNAGNPLGKTAHYEPNSKKVTLFIDGRHIKDILRSLSHELVHHDQNCKGQFGGSMDTGPGYAQNDEHLRNQEKQAYLLGNLHFRDWEDGIKMQQQENKQMNSKKLINEVANRVSRRLIQLKEEKECKCPKDCPQHKKTEKPKKLSKLKSLEEQGKIVNPETGEETKISRAGKAGGHVKKQLKKAAGLEKEKPTGAPMGESLDEEYQLFEQQLDEYLGAGMHPEEVSESKDFCADVSCPEGKECKEVTNNLGQVYKADCVDVVNENWHKGNKDQLLFEELTRKWTKKR